MKIWNLYAPLYETAMKPDQKLYDEVAQLIKKKIRGKEVLELACGPGNLSMMIASAAKQLTATDYAERMIAQAKKKDNPFHIVFEQADAMNLPYEDGSFDAVVIANALHIVPEPEKVLEEIRRVLRPDGILIAPNFVEHEKGKVSRAWTALLKTAGVKFAHEWSAEQYYEFLEENGWKITFRKEIPARNLLAYAEAEPVNS